MKRWISYVVLGLIAQGSLCSAQGLGQAPLTEPERVVWLGVIGILQNGTAGNAWNEVTTFAVMNEIGAFSQLTDQDKGLRAYQYVGETARTDKQIGSTASTRGTTSLLEKPGLATLLALAIERGAVQQEKSGTDVTLRTSPAALFKVLYRSEDGSSAEDDPIYPWLNRVGFSATGPIDQSGGSNNGDLQQLSEWSVQLDLNFWGNRTVYSRDFVKYWRKTVGPAIDQRLMILSKASEDLPDFRPAMREAEKRVKALSQKGLSTRLDTEHFSSGEAIDALRADPIGQQMFKAVQEEARKAAQDAIASGEISPEQQKQLKQAVLDLSKSHRNLAEIKKDLDTKLQDVLAVPKLTAEYTNHKSEMGSNYSEAKFLCQYRVNLTNLKIFPEPFDLIGNAAASFYHHPDRTINQDSVRDYSFGLGAEFGFGDPFPRLISEGDASKITLSLNGKFARLESQGDEAGFAQAKLEIPIVAGVSIPLSVTYATRTEEIDEAEVRGNVGFSFDFDKVYALAGLVALK